VPRERLIVDGPDDATDALDPEAADLTQRADQPEAVDVIVAVVRLVGGGREPGGKEPFAEVELDRRDGNASPSAEVGDSHWPSSFVHGRRERIVALSIHIG
jgi:hypothetical protein